MNSNAINLKCPPVQNDRISLIYDAIDTWVRSSALSRLVEEFGAKIPDELAVETLVEWLLNFSERWDFRKLQQEATANDIGEGARWLLNSSQVAPQQKSLIEESAKILGLIGVDEPAEDSYDYVLILGGAKLSCTLRPRLAAKLIQQRQIQPKAVVLLGSARPVSASERDATNTYAPNAKTEYDLMNAGAAAYFQLDANHSEDKYDAPDNPNCSWKIRTSSVSECSYPLISISAPSSEPEKRRANSADTYEFFFSKFSVGPNSSLLLVTSAIYVPYQQLEALRTLALPHNVMIETVGFPAEWGGQLQGMAEPMNYLQEIRSTIQSADRFIKAFPRKIIS
jgi:hypothetical protein